MKITRVRVFEVEGEQRSGLAIYEVPRGGLATNEITQYRGTFTQIETDEGITGLSCGGSVETKALGELLIGEDPIRVEYLWEKLYQSAYHRLRIANLAVGRAAAERGAGRVGPRGGRPGRRHHGGLPALRSEAELDPLRDRPHPPAGRILADLAGGAAQLRRPGRSREAGPVHLLARRHAQSQERLRWYAAIALCPRRPAVPRHVSPRVPPSDRKGAPAAPEQASSW